MHIIDEGGGHAREAWSACEFRCFLMAVRHAVSTTLAANCTTAQASSSRDRSRPGRSPFTDRDRVGHQTRHAAASGHTADPAPMHVRTCVNVHPRRRSQHRAHSGCAHVPLNPQTLDHFVEPHVLMIVDHLDNERLVCIQARRASPALPPRCRLTIAGSCDPANCRRNPNSEPGGGLPW